jgi:superoxide dismutase
MQSMVHGGGGVPIEPVAKKIATDFGGYEQFAEKFKQAALSQFGSGWIWLVAIDDNLGIVRTSNAQTPLLEERSLPQEPHQLGVRQFTTRIGQKHRGRAKPCRRGLIAAPDCSRSI